MERRAWYEGTNEWVFDLRPDSIEEMALYPALRERLEFYVQSGDFSHLLMHGGVGTGKTTAARILGAKHRFSFIEEDCAKDSSKRKVISVASGTKMTIFGKRQIVLLDEFHEIDEASQRVLNKVMEDRSVDNIFIFCANYMDRVADSICSRCFTLNFDIGTIDPNTSNLQLHPYVNMTKENWISELKRATNIAADKAGVVIPDSTLDKVVRIETNLIEPRTFVRAAEEQFKMDDFNKTSKLPDKKI